MAPQPLDLSGPMAQGHLTTTETQDVDLILSQVQRMNMREVPFCFDFHCEQYQEGVSAWIEKFWATTNAPVFSKPIRIHCKTGSLSVRLVFETRAKCQDSVARYKDDGIPYEVDSPFRQSRTNIAVRQSKSLEDREIGMQFALWKALAEKLKVLFPEGDDLHCPLRSTYGLKFAVLRIAETVWGNQWANLLRLETDSCWLLLLLICVFLVFMMMCCNRSFRKPAIWLRIARPMCDGRPVASPLFRRLAGRGPFFTHFPLFDGLFNLRSLSGSMPDLTGRSTLL